jgi:dihydrofolate reductase
MSKLCVRNFSVSVDGYAAGPDQSLDHPLGVGGRDLHGWALATRSARELFDMEGGKDGVDDAIWRRGDVGVGATIMGRNMFGPIRGEWPDLEWQGWWGEEPPYHHPVFVLTHHARPSIEMKGGTTFHFVTDGIESALEQAREAAGGADVRIGGGAATVQAYLRAQLVDELHIVQSPIFLGGGERLFDHLDGGPHGLTCVDVVSTDAATHLFFERSPEPSA